MQLPRLLNPQINQDIFTPTGYHKTWHRHVKALDPRPLPRLRKPRPTHNLQTLLRHILESNSSTLPIPS
jgi:hypothetical protein